jgi:peroxiredoxin
MYYSSGSLHTEQRLELMYTVPYINDRMCVYTVKCSQVISHVKDAAVISISDTLSIIIFMN